MSKKHLESILQLLDPPKGFQPWHGGPGLMGCLRGVNAKQAAWKPAPGRHSIWELALHMAYWKYAVRRYLNPKTRKGFGKSPANWPVVDKYTEGQWKKDKAFIKKEHEALLAAIKAFPVKRLDDKTTSKKEWTYRQLIEGIAVHDTYHIAQVQLMKRLYNDLSGSG